MPIAAESVYQHPLTPSGESLLHCCRQELQRSADGSAQEGTQAIHSRPGSPLWLNQRPGRLTAMFPVYMHGSPDDPLLSAFIQVQQHTQLKPSAAASLHETKLVIRVLPISCRRAGTHMSCSDDQRKHLAIVVGRECHMHDL